MIFLRVCSQLVCKGTTNIWNIQIIKPKNKKCLHFYIILEQICRRCAANYERLSSQLRVIAIRVSRPSRVHRVRHWRMFGARQSYLNYFAHACICARNFSKKCMFSLQNEKKLTIFVEIFAHDKKR